MDRKERFLSMKRLGVMCLLLMAVILAAGAVDLDREGRDPAYVESIVKRSQKIVDKLELKDAEMAQHVTPYHCQPLF